MADGLYLFLHPGEFARAVARGDIRRLEDGREVWDGAPNVTIIKVQPIPQARHG